jgi:Glutathione S-transferase
MLKIFVAKGACSLASHIALEESGVAYEARRLDLARGDQQSPDYLALNPKARVPTLVTDRGALTETPAILAFVAQTVPQARLAPLDDPFTFAELQSVLSYLCSTVHVAHSHGRRGYRWADDPAALEAMKAKVPETMAACFGLIETSLFRGPWVMGEAYTVADPYLFTLATWLEGDRVDPARFPKVLDHRNRMAERPAVKHVLAFYEG